MSVVRKNEGFDFLREVSVLDGPIPEKGLLLLSFMNDGETTHSTCLGIEIAWAIGFDALPSQLAAALDRRDETVARTFENLHELVAVTTKALKKGYRLTANDNDEEAKESVDHLASEFAKYKREIAQRIRPIEPDKVNKHNKDQVVHMDQLTALLGLDEAQYWWSFMECELKTTPLTADAAA